MTRLLPLVLIVLSACAPGYQSTLLPTAEAGAPPPEYRIQIPDGYDVRSVDYDASLVGIASGNQYSTSTDVRGRGVVAVYAVERATGQEVVLVYDDVAARPTPTAILRLERPSRASR